MRTPAFATSHNYNRVPSAERSAILKVLSLAPRLGKVIGRLIWRRCTDRVGVGRLSVVACLAIWIAEGGRWDADCSVTVHKRSDWWVSAW